MTEPKLIDLKTASQRYSLSRSTIYKMISEGRLQPLKLGKSLRFNVEQTDAALLGE